MPEVAQLHSGFRFEADMAEPVVRWLRLRGLSVKSEFLLPWGVCDLVGVKFSPSKERLRMAYGQRRPVGSLFRLLLLSEIPDRQTGRSVRIGSLGKRMGGFSDDAISIEVGKLARAKFVIFPKAGFVQKLNGWAPLHKKVVAVELKLTRVSEVMSQAVANREFATHSYVALPMNLAARLVRSERRRMFTSEGLGLLGVSAVSCRELIVPKKAAAPGNGVIQMHVVERFWGSRGSSPSVASQ